MSIKYGLQKKTTEVVSPANTFRISQDTTLKDKKLSTTYKYSEAYYAHSKKYDKETSYPFKFQKHILNLQQYTYTLYVYDAKTDELIDPKNLNYEILIVGNNHNSTVIKTNQYFQINFNGYSFLKLTIRITGDDFLSSYVMADSDLYTDHYIQNTKIVNINNVPNGVAVVNTVLQQDQNGTVTHNMLVFPSSATKFEQATISIPQNTIFVTKNNTVLEGPINIKAAHFSPTTAIDLFGAGWDLANIEIDGVPQNNLGFVSGGFYSIEISDNNGNIASRII